MAVLVAAVMVALLAVAAFAVDLGMQRVTRRDMQAVADTVSLDLSRLVDGRTRSQIEAGTAGVTASLTAAKDASVARNATSIVGSRAHLTVTPYLVTLIDDSSDPDTAKDNYATTNGVPDQVPSTDVPDAVVVIATTDVQFGFGAAIGRSQGSASRSALAQATQQACFKIGSYAARLDASTSPLFTSLLNGALGNLSVGAATYQGLANANVTLAGIATALGLGGVDQLASANVTARQVILAAATVLSQNGDTANAAALNAIAAQLGSGQAVNLGGVIDATTGGATAATATINVLDLISGTAFLANGSSALSIPGVTTNLGLSNLTTSANLIQGAQEKCGKRGIVASTSQSDVTITGNLADVATPSAINGLNLSVDANSTSIALHLASAKGTLTDIICGAGTSVSPQGVDVEVKSELGTVSRLSQTIKLNGTLGSGVLGGLLGGLLGNIASVQVVGTLALSAVTSQPATTRTAQIRVPNNPTTWTKPVSTGSGDLGLNTANVVATWTSGPTLVAKTLLGLNTTLSLAQQAQLLNNVVSSVSSSFVNPLVTTLNDTLINPLSGLLGLSLGGADVYGIPVPSCTTPQLIG